MPAHRDHARRLLGFARRMRCDCTDAERKMWQLLRGRKLADFKFRRQYPVAGYIVDFFCPAAALVLELDGGQHTDPAAAAYDHRRTARLNALGIRVLRFWDHDVLKDTDAVQEAIYGELTGQTSAE